MLITFQASGLSNTSGLPANVKLLSLEQWDDSSVLLRLENTFEMNEDSLYGKPVNVSLKVILSSTASCIDMVYDKINKLCKSFLLKS